ncbi:hypothetical protein Gotur_024675 [Gossypium turneri]
MDTIRGSGNSGSNPGRVFTKSERLARESGVDQLCNRGAPPDRRVLRQFGCRQPIPADLEVFDNHHKINLRLLACIPEYMPWFRIHGKLYLLTPEERQRQIRVGRERRRPLNPRRQNYEGSPATRPRQSPGSSSAAMQSSSPTRAPTQSPDAAIQ